jgi:hypothetical protein
MTTGFLLAGLAWTLWWNLDWRRFIKFYGISGPQYRPWVAIGFRIFFALCSLGAAENLGRRLLQEVRPVQFHSECLLEAAAWFTVFVLLVKTVEWLNSKRKKVSPYPNDSDKRGMSGTD